jgi:hypothetical protein
MGTGLAFPPVRFNVNPLRLRQVACRHTEDWGIIESDLEDHPSHNVNAIGLSDEKSHRTARPDLFPPLPDDASTDLPVKGTLSQAELAERSLVVLKTRAITDFTIGRCSPLQSFLIQKDPFVRASQRWIIFYSIGLVPHSKINHVSFVISIVDLCSLLSMYMCRARQSLSRQPDRYIIARKARQRRGIMPVRNRSCWQQRVAMISVEFHLEP